MPYSEESYSAFKQLPIPYTIDTRTTGEALPKSDDAGISICTEEPQYSDKVVVKLIGFKADVNFIKSLPERSYDSAMKRWIVPADPVLIDRIKAHLTGQGVKIIDRLAKEDLHYTKQQFSSNDRITHLIKKYPTVYTAMIEKVTGAMIRHCFATHLMDGGLDSRYIQELLGHKDIKTTLIYTHVTNSSMNQIVSPLDFLNKNKKRKS